ncbi:hypothetical protein BB558_006964 [Smittium angustum]|uniref:Carbohydrate-binding module family 19 domain-containing protein n=1 Tax=Smittium angustum TaxID=133377 RepID=A0A2U1IWA6_SMIAN|nr:hypothetical protein BB558_006964 [Smittium angustum]
MFFTVLSLLSMGSVAWEYKCLQAQGGGREYISKYEAKLVCPEGTHCYQSGDVVKCLGIGDAMQDIMPVDIHNSGIGFVGDSRGIGFSKRDIKIKLDDVGSKNETKGDNGGSDKLKSYKSKCFNKSESLYYYTIDGVFGVGKCAFNTTCFNLPNNNKQPKVVCGINTNDTTSVCTENQSRAITNDGCTGFYTTCKKGIKVLGKCKDGFVCYNTRESVICKKEMAPNCSNLKYFDLVKLPKLHPKSSTKKPSYKTQSSSSSKAKSRSPKPVYSGNSQSTDNEEPPTESETEPPAEIETEPPIEQETEPENQPQTEQETEPSPEPPVKPETKPSVNPETEPPVEPSKTNSKPTKPVYSNAPPESPNTEEPLTESETKPPAKPETKPPVNPETKPPVKPETKPSVNPETEPPVAPSKTNSKPTKPVYSNTLLERPNTEEPSTEPKSELPIEPSKSKSTKPMYSNVRPETPSIEEPLTELESEPPVEPEIDTPVEPSSIKSKPTKPVYSTLPEVPRTEESLPEPETKPTIKPSKTNSLPTKLVYSTLSEILNTEEPPTNPETEMPPVEPEKSSNTKTKPSKPEYSNKLPEIPGIDEPIESTTEESTCESETQKPPNPSSRKTTPSKPMYSNIFSKTKKTEKPPKPTSKKSKSSKLVYQNAQPETPCTEEETIEAETEESPCEEETEEPQKPSSKKTRSPKSTSTKQKSSKIVYQSVPSKTSFTKELPKPSSTKISSSKSQYMQTLPTNNLYKGGDPGLSIVPTYNAGNIKPSQTSVKPVVVTRTEILEEIEVIVEEDDIGGYESCEIMTEASSLENKNSGIGGYQNGKKVSTQNYE